jgi:hypothetical protein
VRITRAPADGRAAAGGAARVIVRAAPVLGLRRAETTAARDVQVQPIRRAVTVVSTHLSSNHGGAEFIIYRYAARGGLRRRPGREAAGYPASGVRRRRRSAIRR